MAHHSKSANPKRSKYTYNIRIRLTKILTFCLHYDTINLGELSPARYFCAQHSLTQSGLALFERKRMNELKRRRQVKKIGGDVDEYEIDEPIQVTVRRTLLGRLIDLAWMVTATVIALTLLNVFILPLIT